MNYHVTIKSFVGHDWNRNTCYSAYKYKCFSSIWTGIPAGRCRNGWFWFNPVPSINPFDLSGLGTAGVYGRPELMLVISTYFGTFGTTSGTAIVIPAYNFSNAIPWSCLQWTKQFTSWGYGPRFVGCIWTVITVSWVTITSRFTCTICRALKQYPVTIHACMDPASGNIPVNSIGSSSANGCLFQTVPVVITMDEAYQYDLNVLCCAQLGYTYG